VLLKTRDGNKFLPIWIGHPEAAAILMKLQGANTPRPMTHDLISEMLSELDVSCTRVAVTELRENTFYAR
jgi:bifunctional DNase/RNase